MSVNFNIWSNEKKDVMTNEKTTSFKLFSK